MKRKRSLAALGAFLTLAVGLAVAGCGGVPGDSVATMAGNPITRQAFNHWMYVAAKSQAMQSPGQPVIVPNDPPDFKNCIATVRSQIASLAKTPDKTIKTDCQTLFTSLSTQVMDFLVKAYWYQAEAHRLNITVSDAQVNKAFDAARGQQFPTDAQFNAFLAQSGETRQDILYRFRVSQLYQKLIAKQGSTASSAQIQSYYNSHKSQFGTPESRDMRIILAKDASSANAAKAALAGGQSWNAVAKQYSTDAQTKSSGGLLTGVIKGQEDATLDSASFSAQAGKLLGPVKGQFGYYVFEVTKTHPASQQTLAQATTQIRRLLSQQQQQSAVKAVDDIAKKNWLSKTQCRSQYSMADCTGYKAPKTSTTPTATTG